ncbi:MAG: PLP-dependent transferase [Lachnospiraceae bacterium]|nr:PLP-dependent transferase [Lachnospiraceae bacterium]
MKKNLSESLDEYIDKKLYPMHMPGHKRRLKGNTLLTGSRTCEEKLASMALYDLTEVKGTDDLHNPEGFIRESVKRTEKLFGAASSRYLVNGSTCGILAAVLACCKRGDIIIAGRNCHISVCHAIELGDLRVKWVEPEYDPDFEIFTYMDKMKLEKAIKDTKERIGALIITSPTYEGYISDIGAIAGLCDKEGIPLIVDEAHGAHLRFTDRRHEAVENGADIVIQSPHKTLSSLTQTALLHISGKAIKSYPWIERKIDEKLSVLETSSPSYPLLASIDNCVDQLVKSGEELSGKYRKMLDRTYDILKELKVFKAAGSMDEGPLIRDRGKILINCKKSGINGVELSEIMREKYGYETEYANAYDLLAMTSMWDDEEKVLGFAKGLLIEDKSLYEKNASKKKERPLSQGIYSKGVIYDRDLLGSVMTIADAMESVFEEVSFEELKRADKERLCAEYIYCYPPGIPFIVPGETVKADFIRYLEEAKKSGSRILKSRSKDNDSISCIIDGGKPTSAKRI